MNTKLILLLLVLSVFATSLLKAQQITYGIQAGGGISTIVDDIKPDVDINLEVDDFYKPMFSYTLNVYVGYKSESFWGVTLEPGFIQKGAKSKALFVGDTYNQIGLNCLQLPVLADLYLGKKITVSLGPDFSYLLSTKAKLDDGSQTTIEGIYTKTEVSGIIGVSYALSEKFVVGMRYDHGITPIMNIELVDEQGVITQSKYKLYNQYGQFYLRFKI